MMSGMILLTGSTGHLGSAMLRDLLQDWSVICLSRRSVDLDNIDPSFRDRLYCLNFDIKRTNLNSIIFELERILDVNSVKLSGLVNNACFLETTSATDMTNSACESALHGLFAFHVKLTLEIMDRGLFSASSSVINVSSMYAKVAPDPSVYLPDLKANPLLYGAMKAALSQSTRYLSAIMAPSGTRVNSVSYGPFPNFEVQRAYPDFVDNLAAKTHLRRVGSPEESVGVIRFLLSPQSSYVTGSDISVDGGWTAW